jgi:aminocarboxymuconate-semialdehyde decarboxylase
MSFTHRIGVHHVVPPFWAKAMPNHGGDPSGPRSGDSLSTILPQWSPESAIDLMHSQKIATGILSLTAPGGRRLGQERATGDGASRQRIQADLVAKRPGRFGNFATLPLPDVNGALSEIEYALDTLRVDGVIFLGNYA